MAQVRAAIIAGVPQLSSLPAPVSSPGARRIRAVRFIHSALTYSAAERPSAEQLLEHDWLAATNDDAAVAAATAEDKKEKGNGNPCRTGDCGGVRCARGRDNRCLRVESDPGGGGGLELGATRREGLGGPVLFERPLTTNNAPATVATNLQPVSGRGSTASGGRSTGPVSGQQAGAGNKQPEPSGARTEGNTRPQLLSRPPSRNRLPRLISVPSADLDRLMGGSSSSDVCTTVPIATTRGIGAAPPPAAAPAGGAARCNRGGGLPTRRSNSLAGMQDVG